MTKIQTLDSGVRVVTERIDAVRSCGIGLWLELGSRLENDENNGISHFIEHMLFKGTARIDARELADAINYLGGNINAFTSQETLCLHGRTVDKKAHLALDLLGEMLLESAYPPAELKRERKVVLEEFKMYEDSPDELCVDRFIQNLWPSHPLGRPVVGSKATIRSFSREMIDQYMAEEFQPSRIVISIAGAYDHRACMKIIDRRFGKLKPVKGKKQAAKKTGDGGQPIQTVIRRQIEQSHFCLGCESPKRTSPERYAFGLMNMILGGGMSSRLFQEIREKRGLSYSVGSFVQPFSDRGFFAVNGGTSPNTLGEVLTITMREIERICDEDVPQQELDLAQEQVLDALLIGLENTESRMSRQAESVLAYGRVLGLDEIIENVKAVKVTDVRRVAKKYLSRVARASALVIPKGTGLKAGHVEKMEETIRAGGK